jgi:hypothetical protein
VEKNPTRTPAPLSRDGGWLPAPVVANLRDLTTRYLDGDRAVDGAADEIASAFAVATHESGLPPERLLIAMRALWRDFGFSQSDRLQLAALYDRLIRIAIARYYEH